MDRFWTWFFRILFLAVIVTILSTALFVLSDRWQALKAGDLVEGGDASLNPVERFYLQTYLTANAQQLTQPAGVGSQPATFVISPGETADGIATNLVAAGLLADADLFVRYVRYHGYDSQLEAGEFNLSPQLTIPELAGALTQAFAREIELRFFEGWRLEEMARYLADTNPGLIDADSFLDIVQRRAPFDLSAYDFLASLPAEASLEGYLFPDTYRVPTGADAAYLVASMLDNFGRRVTPAMRQSYGSHGLTLRQAVTLASIVEREAVIPEERPMIARVFYNRLDQGMKLEADPTTQYALGYQPDSGKWWKSPLYLDDLEIDSPYNTYVADALPPGPIANPGLSSLQAVAQPAAGSFLFFVADCTAGAAGAHDFSETFDEHLVKVERCR